MISWFSLKEKPLRWLKPDGDVSVRVTDTWRCDVPQKNYFCWHQWNETPVQIKIIILLLVFSSALLQSHKKINLHLYQVFIAMPLAVCRIGPGRSRQLRSGLPLNLLLCLNKHCSPQRRNPYDFAASFMMLTFVVFSEMSWQVFLFFLKSFLSLLLFQRITDVYIYANSARAGETALALYLKYGLSLLVSLIDYSESLSFRKSSIVKNRYANRYPLKR